MEIRDLKFLIFKHASFARLHNTVDFMKQKAYDLCHWQKFVTSNLDCERHMERHEAYLSIDERS